MRMVGYETERKRSGVRSAAAASRAVVAGGQRRRRSSGNRWCFRVFGKAVASGCGERRHGGAKSQATSRPQAPPECEAEAPTDRNSLGWTAKGWVPERSLDLS